MIVSSYKKKSILLFIRIDNNERRRLSNIIINSNKNKTKSSTVSRLILSDGSTIVFEVISNGARID